MSWEQAGDRGASWSEGSELGVRGVSTVYAQCHICMELYSHGAIYAWSHICMEPYTHGAVYAWSCICMEPYMH